MWFEPGRVQALGAALHDGRGDEVDRLLEDILLYFHELLPLLQAGADNRVNMHRVLTSRRTADEYTALYGLYRRRQTDVLGKLNALAVPERLEEVHRRVVTATEQQIAFFGAFVGAKVKDPEIDLRRMLPHPALQTTSRELHTAWDLVRRMYPALDRDTSDAIESRLCQFDVI